MYSRYLQCFLPSLDIVLMLAVISQPWSPVCSSQDSEESEFLNSSQHLKKRINKMSMSSIHIRTIQINVSISIIMVSRLEPFSGLWVLPTIKFFNLFKTLHRFSMIIPSISPSVCFRICIKRHFTQACSRSLLGFG